MIAHELYTRTEPVYRNYQNVIIETFNLKSADWAESRKQLGDIVFNDAAALDKLNELARPLILSSVRQKMLGFQGLILMNGALLVEANFLPLCNNNVIVVNTDSNEQFQNLKDRGLTDIQIQRRINSQLDNNQKLQKIREEISKHRYGTCIPYSNSKTNSPYYFVTLTRQVSELTYMR